MLLNSKDAYNHQGVLHLLLTGLADSKDSKVRMVALEGLAVMGAKLGSSELQSLMRQNSVADSVKAQVEQRLANPALPTINADGMVEHVADPLATSTDGLEATLGAHPFGGGERTHVHRSAMRACRHGNNPCTWARGREWPTDTPRCWHAKHAVCHMLMRLLCIVNLHGVPASVADPCLAHTTAHAYTHGPVPIGRRTCRCR